MGLSRRFDVAVIGAGPGGYVTALRAAQLGRAVAVIEADHIVLATGSTDWVPPGISVDGNIVMTSREALNASEAPNRLVVIGGGAVGIELAYVYAMYGTEVDLVEMEEQLLPGADREVAGALRRELRRKGLRIHLNTQYRELKIRDGEARVTVTSGGEESELRADRVLIAMGRRPLSDGLGLDDIGIDRDAHGFVCVDGNHRTRVPTISAIGDLAGGPLLAHKASEEGVAVAELLAGLSRRRLEAHEIPTCIYSQPQVAWVGRTELQASALYGDDVRVGVFPFSASGRATAAGERAGFAKIIAEPAYGEIVGAHVVGCGATELVPELSLAMRMEATTEDIAQVPHPHPTLSEAILEATLAAEGHALHL